MECERTAVRLVYALAQSNDSLLGTILQPGPGEGERTYGSCRSRQDSAPVRVRNFPQRA